MGSEYMDYTNAVSKPMIKSFRINTLKASIGDLNGVFDMVHVPWCDDAFFTSDDVGNSLEHFLGLIYVQEAASMLAAKALMPAGGDLVLDLCAAPGSKTTQLAALMGNTGAIVANEIDWKRLKTLRFNLNRMGVVNTVLTHSDGTSFSSDARFDKILVDAPCSNLGQLSDNPEAGKSFNKSLVKRCSTLQKRLLDNAIKHLKPGGTLVYSTCTYTVEENEEVVDYAVGKYGLKIEEVVGDFKSCGGIISGGGNVFSKDVSKTTRIYPHHNGTHGFYLAKLKK
ncbi:MAG: RsmB/NOP family class I SAM-dependent RNA methyltransferase [Candidatus Altiarchaeota archaeon]|nr:RsmB/NOP family class I SAM-dependent RNA methyltransferase [Candidatus Altiarchaeota archaeon]